MGLPLESMADRLRAQARALQSRGLELCRAGEDLKAEALELFNDADRFDRAPVHVGVGKGVRREPGTVHELPIREDDPLEERACTLLAVGGMTTRQLADHLGTGRLRVKGIMERLEAAGTVYKTGVTSSTRWHLTEPEAIRTGAATLHVFTRTTSARELEDRRVAWSTEAPAADVLPEADNEL